MANEEHLARLKQGVEAWNEWRSRNPTSCSAMTAIRPHIRLLVDGTPDAGVNRQARKEVDMGH